MDNNSNSFVVIKRWNANPNVVNKIINNNFDNIYLTVSTYFVPNYNLIFSSNDGTVQYYNGGTTAYYSGYYDTNINDYNNTSSNFPNHSYSGFFEWSYNGSLMPVSDPTSDQPLAFTNNYGETDVIDGGNPNHEYYDIDLSINDRGINGGPYSQLNYNANNPNNSRAFIFDLEMPADLFPGQNVEIKAQGYHSN